VKKINLILFILLLNITSLLAQKLVDTPPPSRNCGFTEHLEHQKQEDPQLDQNIRDLNEWVENYVANYDPSRSGHDYMIPVVFHVVYRTAAENISDAQLISQLDVLNEDFRRLNADRINTPSEFATISADSKIEFCLAVRDPNNNPTTGITRTATSVTSFSTNDNVKRDANGGRNPWPRDSYLNIWVCNLGTSLLGYAQFPGGDAATDGVVLNYRYTGRYGSALAPFNLGRTGTHEVGHWLGLYHIWGDDGGACTGSDQVADTPNQGNSYSGCPSHPRNSCGSNDMFMNYMDYVDDNCMNAFTQGQNTRMHGFLDGFRAPLQNSLGCTPFANLDAGISSISSPTGTICSSSFTPVVTLQNYGANTLTSVTINYNVDGGTNQTFSWTGSLASGQTINVTLPTQTSTNGSHTFTAFTSNPNGGTDENTSNNSSSSSFTLQTNGNGVNLNLLVDCFGDEITWNITNSMGSVVASGGPYSNVAGGTQVNQSYCLPNDCYTFTINDSYGDGLAGNGVSGCTTNGNYTITDDFGNVLVQMTQVNFGNQATHNFCVPVVTNNNDAGITAILSPTGSSCSTEISPQVTLQNFGTNTLTSVVINYNVDGGTNQTFNWTGSLAQNTSITVTLPNMTVAAGNHTFNAFTTLPNGLTDEEPTNDASSSAFSITSGTTVNLNLLVDCFGDEITWNITNSMGSVIASGGPYTVIQGGTQVNQTYCLPNDCYTFTINDSYGDGLAGLGVSNCNTNGNYTITDDNGNVLVQMTQVNFGNQATHNFCVPVSNCSSTTSVQNVSCFGGNNGSATVDVTGGISPISYNWSNGQTGATANNLLAGVYQVTVTDAGSCFDVQSVTITQPTQLTLSVSTINETCTYANGTASASVNGGVTPYTYNWSNGATSSSISNLSAGTYSITVADNNACSNTSSFTITDSPSPIVNITVSDAYCGNANGQASALVSGGTSPLSYLWSNGAVTETATNLIPNTYSVTVTDNNACFDVQSVVVGNVVYSLAISGTVENEICNNAQGQITTSTTGGSTPYSYNWSNGNVTPSISGLSAGTYNLTVSDTNGCSEQESFAVSNNNITISVSTSVTDAICSSSTGSASLNPTNGTSPYSYNWSNGANTSFINNLFAGNYGYTVSDVYGCTTSGSITVGSTASLVELNTTITEASCGLSNGEIQTEAMNGTAPYSYNWSNGATSSFIQNLSVGTYHVTVSDANLCQFIGSYNVTNLSGISVTLSKTDETCGSSNGTAEVVVSGGSLPYSYSWSNGSTVSTANGLSASTVSVTITDAASCNIIESFVIVNIQQEITTSVLNPHCGNADGEITASVTNGLEPYQYLWSNGQTSSSIVNLIAGQYSLTVTDANTCQVTTSVNLTDISGPDLTLTAINESCNLANGSVSSSVISGQSPYTYLWSNGQTSSSVSGLTAGTYSLTVADLHNCSATESVTISNVSGPVVNVTSTPVSCGGTDGTASVSVSGGVSPYTFNWSNGGNTATISGLAAGTYQVTVSDFSGCSAIESVTVSSSSTKRYTVEITTPSCNGPNVTWQILDASSNIVASGSMGRGQTRTWDVCDCGETFVLNAPPGTGGAPASRCPAGISPESANIYDSNDNLIGSTSANGGTVNLMGYSGCSFTCPTINVNVSSSNVTCFGENNGSAQASASGGISPYAYLWSNTSTTSSVSGLAAGVYSVTVSDDLSCEGTQSITITQPALLSSSTSQNNVSCFSGNNGSASVSASGGTSPYVYSWSNSGNTATISNLTAGVYSVTVLDNFSCQTTNSVTITQPSDIIISGSITDAVCSGSNGSIQTSASGGVGSLAYFWNNGVVSNINSGISEGNYTLTVTDANGCSKTSSYSVENTAGPSLTLLDNDATCNESNGSVNSNISGGTSPFNYVWSNGATTSNISGLFAGSYSLTVTDVNGCLAFANTFINNVFPTIVSLSTVDETCSASNGQISSEISGGSTPYTYTWSNGNNTSAISGISAGAYTLTVVDNAGCLAFETATIQNFAEPTISTSSIDAACGQANGEVSVTIVSGGTTPFSYLWSNGGTSPIEKNLTANTYQVIVFDANGCSVSATAVVNNISGPTADVTTTLSSCNVNDGTATAIVSAGTSPYTYSWSFGGGGQTAGGLGAGSYSVTISDNNNCIAVRNFTISLSSSPSITVTATDENCDLSNGTAAVTISGGTSPYGVLWSNGATSSTLSGLSADTYSVTATDNKGCSASSSIIINNLAGPSVELTPSTASCNTNDGEIIGAVNGGQIPYQYLWSNGTTTLNNLNLSAGTYVLTLTDNANCQVITQATVNNNIPLVSVTTTPPTCGLSNGTATLTASGGATPYSYLWTDGLNSSFRDDLLAGNYQVTVHDNGGCSVLEVVTIQNGNGSLTLTDNVVNATCGLSNGSAEINVSGGTSPYSFVWSTGATTAAVSGLNAANHFVTVTDINNCQAVLLVKISNIVGPTSSVNQTNATCNEANGSAEAIVSGGTTPYSYIWSNGATTSILTNINAGSYMISVTDNNNCLSVASTTITNSGIPQIAISVTDAACGTATGEVITSVTGGNTPYSYFWTNSATTSSISNLAAGSYTLNVSDNSSCVSSVNALVNNIGSPLLSVSITDASCNLSNGVIILSTSGGTSPYNYLWSNGASTLQIENLSSGNYQVTVSDDNNCLTLASYVVNQLSSPVIQVTTSFATCGQANGSATVEVLSGSSPYFYLWSNGETTELATGLNPGNYLVSVTDVNGCMSSGSATIQNEVPGLTLSSTPEYCGQSNGTASVQAVGGVIPYTYLWSNGGTSTVNTGLSSNNYQVTVTDASGCIAVNSVFVSEIDGPTVTHTLTDASCGNNDGEATAFVSGGTSPYTYQWTNGATTQGISGLPQGTYSVVVSDNRGCVAVESVQINNVNGPILSVSVVDAFCNQPNGSAALTITGGTSPYSINWSGGTNTNLLPGNYSVMVTDDNGCVNAASYTISNYLQPCLP
jgi:hypothetical protein